MGKFNFSNARWQWQQRSKERKKTMPSDERAKIEGLIGSIQPFLSEQGIQLISGSFCLSEDRGFVSGSMLVGNGNDDPPVRIQIYNRSVNRDDSSLPRQALPWVKSLGRAAVKAGYGAHADEDGTVMIPDFPLALTYAGQVTV